MSISSKKTGNSNKETSVNISENLNTRNGDLPDSPQDRAKMVPETVILDLPDVKDIPGQEFIHPAPFGEMADTTISSDDEEGIGIFEDEEDEELITGKSNITSEEKRDLRQADENMPTKDDQSIRNAALDNEDEDGVPLNQKGFGTDVTGNDLDISGADEDDANEEIGEEDEENNVYSASDENNDNIQDLSSKL